MNLLESCLRRKTIYQFLKSYKQKKWNNIIPSLLEIAILNLNNQFKQNYYSEEDLAFIIKKLHSNNKINESYYDISPNLRNTFTSYESFNNERNRSFSKKAKNINELNIYTNYNFDNKVIHYYNRNSKATPIKRLINNSGTEDNFLLNKPKNFLKLELNKNKYESENKKIKKMKNDIMLINDINKTSINYNTIDLGYVSQTSEKCFSNFNNNLLYNYKMNTEYIKVNKAKKRKKIKERFISDDDLDNNNTYCKNVDTKLNNTIEKINKSTKIKLINSFIKDKSFFANYKKNKINKESTQQNVFNINALNNQLCNKFKKNVDKTNNNTDSIKLNNKFDFINKTKNIKNIANKINMKKIKLSDIRNQQINKMKKNRIIDKNEIKALNMTDLDFNNIDDIDFRIKKDTSKKPKNMKTGNLTSTKKNTINYNFCNSDIRSKFKTFINDPYFLVKISKNKK